jgi:hypothetical protein
LFNHISREFRLAISFPKYLGNYLTIEHAIEELKFRLENRERRFLQACKKLIFNNPRSPYLKLLLWAGCNFQDFEKSVYSNGIESTLEKLRNQDVYLTPEEFKSQTPICRKGLTIETTPGDFDNPYLLPKSLHAATSGTASKSTRVLYDWNFMLEEAANEMLLYETHGVLNAPSAFWLPSLPSISGIHNVLIHMRFRKPPDKWFSQLQPDLKSRIKMKYVARCGQIYKMKMPDPEFTEINNAERVARWMENVIKEKGICVVKTFASSAIRIAQAAVKCGMDLSGSIMFTGGEPLTDRRHKYLQAAGIKAFARFVATESGWISGGCNNAEAPDTMHIYTDRMALIQRRRTANNINALLFTTLSSHTPKVLLNAELGDSGTMTQRNCDCSFGKLGMNLHVSEVRSFDKFTYEGMTLPGSILDEVISELVQNAGGGPDDYQYIENQNEEGLIKLTISISPHVKIPDEKVFADTILQNLQSKSAAANIASYFWKQADTLQIVREIPQISRGFKMLPIVRNGQISR